MPEIRIGISGWTYPPWRGSFYPGALPQRLELAYASRRFNTIEVNGTHYSLQRPAAFQSWYDDSPPGFVFAIKAGRYITHLRRLKEPRQALANFFASGMLRLREKLGPILWQFPPFFAFDKPRFEEFFEMLPRDTAELARLGKEHAPFLEGRTDLRVDVTRPVRHAVEFRHESFMTERFVDLLRKHHVALVIADVASRYPTTEDVTTDWVYVRLHGSRQLYASGYTPREIRAWAARVRAWHKGGEPGEARRVGAPARASRKGRDIFVFFDNTDVKLRAPVDARSMAKQLGIGPSQTPRQVLDQLGVAARRSRSARPKKTATRKA